MYCRSIKFVKILINVIKMRIFGSIVIKIFCSVKAYPHCVAKRNSQQFYSDESIIFFKLKFYFVKKKKLQKWNPGSVDNKVIEIEKYVALYSVTIKNMIEDLGGIENVEIPITTIDGEIAKLVFAYTKHYIDYPSEHTTVKKLEEEKFEPLDKYTTKFFEKFNYEKLIEFLQAAKFLDIKSTLYCASKHLAYVLKSFKQLKDMRYYLGEINNFTSKEYNEI